MFSPLKTAAATAALLAGLVSVTTGCGPVAAPAAAEWPPMAKKWFKRAQDSYRHADVEDAERSIDNALKLVPDQEEVRILAARVALAQLNYEQAVRVLKGVDSSDARALRGRALWYSGKIDQAADELELLNTDPNVRDPWAQAVAKLARRGAGRTPFAMSGGLLAVSEMPRVNATSLVVPVEVNGEKALGLIATGYAEAVVDSSSGTEPTWVSLRFGDRVEVKDVPALTKDLSGLSRDLKAPIKILLGVNLLRHLRATIDFGGDQFVVRSFEPPPPPQATTVRLNYARGGGMIMRSSLGLKDDSPNAALLVDTAMTYPIALDAGGWKKAGVPLKSLTTVRDAGDLKQGLVPMLRLGAFEVPRIPGVKVDKFEQGLEIDLDGLVGAGLLAAFRVTFSDGGRSMWLEDAPPVSQPGAPPQPGSDQPTLENPDVKLPGGLGGPPGGGAPGLDPNLPMPKMPTPKFKNPGQPPKK